MLSLSPEFMPGPGDLIAESPAGPSAGSGISTQPDYHGRGHCRRTARLWVPGNCNHRPNRSMNLNISIRTPVARSKATDFIVELLVDFLAPDAFAAKADGDRHPQSQRNASLFPKAAEATEESGYLVGRLWAERLDWLDVQECGQSLQAVCDARSGAWELVLSTLSRNGGATLRADLGLQAFMRDVIFVHELLVHPEVPDRLSLVAAGLAGCAGDSTLILMQHEQGQPHHLEEWECRDLGFKKIARSNLLIRDNRLQFPFANQFPMGRPVEFFATAEHEAWLLERWSELVTDHPAL